MRKRSKRVIKGPKNKRRTKTISEDFVKHSIAEWLANNDYTKNLKINTLRGKGVDIKARNRLYPRYFMVETKGQTRGKSADENAFMSSVAQIITRMNIGGSTNYKFGLGLPHTSAKIALRRLPWQVAKRLSLYILSVDYNKNVTKYSYKDLKEHQLGKSNLTVKKSA